MSKRPFSALTNCFSDKENKCSCHIEDIHHTIVAMEQGLVKRLELLQDSIDDLHQVFESLEESDIREESPSRIKS